MNDMKSIKIGVIIPVYQAKNYLRECVDSVLSQTYSNWEMVLVDDGSTDGSQDICDLYAEGDTRITVVHQKNSGLSDARNSGLKAISEAVDYIIFMDSDDFWDNGEVLATLVERVNVTDADVINFSFFRYNDITKDKTPYLTSDSMPLTVGDKRPQCEFLTDNGLYISSACTKLIKRELLDYELDFVSGVHSEDVDWSLRLMLKAGSLDYIGSSLYCYRYRDDSISHVINSKKCTDLCNNILNCISYSEKADPNIRESAYKYTAFQYGTFFMVQSMTENYQKECVEKLSKHRSLLRYHCGNRKLIALRFLTLVFGVRLTCRVIRSIYHRKG